MTSQDKPGIMHILHNTPEFKASEVDVAEELIDSYLNDPRGSGYHILVTETNSVVQGYICFGSTPMTEGTWDIYWMAVAPDMQGRGMGGALIKSAESQIKEAGGRMAIIETSTMPSYAKTRHFHKRNGYETIAHIPDFYEPGDDKLILLKRLD